MNDASLEIRRFFSDYLENRISIADFQQQVAVTHWNIENVAPSMRHLVYKAVGKLAEYSRGHRTEASLREEMANICNAPVPDGSASLMTTIVPQTALLF